MTSAIIEVTGFTANILSNLAFIPQIIKSFRKKRVEDISIGMFLVLFTTQICWIIYAIPLGARNLWISSIIEIALLAPIFIMWFKYRKKNLTLLPASNEAEFIDDKTIVRLKSKNPSSIAWTSK